MAKKEGFSQKTFYISDELNDAMRLHTFLTHEDISTTIRAALTQYLSEELVKAKEITSQEPVKGGSAK